MSLANSCAKSKRRANSCFAFARLIAWCAATESEVPPAWFHDVEANAPAMPSVEAIREEILRLIRIQYGDFGPTLAAKKLHERHGYRLSAETLRQWMIAEGLWQPKSRKRVRIHQRRLRRPCRGELIQIDGSPHDWFEGRGPRCTLIVFIDDATGELMALCFAPAETTGSTCRPCRRI